VNLRVRVAEIDRTITRELGINWQALGSPGKFQFGLFTGLGASGALSAITPSTSSSLLATPFQLGAGYKSGPWDINSVIDALAEDQLVTILAEPNLTALSGQTASFLAGGEFPVPVAAQNGSTGVTISISFKQYGVSLSFVPTVLGPDLINLKVEPEVSSLSTQGAISVPTDGGTLTIPALTVRRAQTTVELGSGQSFAIAGLLEHTTSQQLQGLPGLGQIPVLGPLFRSTQFQRGETELVIIVTPYLVKPASSPALLAAPTDHFHPATDLDRLLLGHTLATPPGEHRLDAGFVVQ
jgi:pilus assembly protein CpaC